MSLGIGAFCRLAAQDEKTIIYQYGAYNLNEHKYENKQRIADGLITIQKSSLIELYIHDKRKGITKRIPKEIQLSNLFKNNLITVENCSHCWKTTENGIDIMARTTIWHIFLKYQEDGYLPETLSINK